jgi:hypothetical protein
MRPAIRLSFAALVCLILVACSEDDGPGGPDATATGDLPFLAACTASEQCASGLCFNFNARGLYCTHACESGAQCESPSPGCNNMNVCKAP